MAQMGKYNTHPSMGIKQGIELHGEKAIKAMLSEYTQLDDNTIFEALDASKLTKEMKNAALNLLTLIKEKRDGRIKGRACADGRKQRAYISKNDIASPIIQLENLMISLLIDAYEGRDVATANVFGAYLMADMNNTIIVKLTGEPVKLMCETNEKYKQFITIENGKEVL